MGGKVTVVKKQALRWMYVENNSFTTRKKTEERVRIYRYAFQFVKHQNELLEMR